MHISVFRQLKGRKTAVGNLKTPAPQKTNKGSYNGYVFGDT